MIEIVGWSGRLPGANNPAEFWDVLKDGKCVVTETPDDRWWKFHFLHPRVKEHGKTYTFAAGVIDDLMGFDPGVFGISPREAEQMDPQQRVLLQVTWEALENSGVAPSEIAGQDVGVFVGASGLDYGTMASLDISAGTGHFMTGNTLSIIANRTSYIFDFRGPSFVVDTACSSSLVALREATVALETGKIDTAIVAGVNVLLSPFPFIGFAHATMLSPQGLCRAFDEEAHGYVRAEGCVAMVLRRSDATPWPGQRSHADIIASDVNSDGRTVGMSLPSSIDQANLLERIYAESGVDPEDLAFIEAHGTGTRVGDPAEAGSIGKMLGQRRSKPLPIGSVKTNIGHLEPASGLAGLAKSVLALENDYLPKSLHFDTPNPDIDFQDLNIEVASEGRPLPRSGRRRYAGVNSFGFGGTNAHVIIADPERANAVSATNDAGSGYTLLLSANSTEALRDTVQNYERLIASSKADEVSDISAASYHRRRAFREKLVVTGKTKKDLLSGFASYLEGKSHPTSKSASAEPKNGKCAFVFSGNGSQWPGMGRLAYQNNAIFRTTFDEINDAFEKHGGYIIRDLLFAEDLEEKLALTSLSQPLIFAVQVAIVRALAAAGLKPDITFGHSIGEAAAAVAAEKLTLDEAVRLVFHRSSEQEAVAGAGTMAALVMPEAEAVDFIAQSGFTNIEIAAVNSHKSLTISGPNEEIAAFAKYARRKHVAVRAMGLNYPFHSRLIGVVEAPFRNVIGTVDGRSSEIAMLSTVTAEPIDGSDLGADYWWRNLREPVRFAPAVRRAIEDGATSFVEIGPKPILQSYLKQELAEADLKGAILSSLKADEVTGDHDPIAAIMADAIAQGAPVDDAKVFGKNPARSIDLPNYPWQNKPFEFARTVESNRGLVARFDNPLLGWRVNETSNVWLTHLDASVLPFLADHVVSGQVIFPGAGYVEIALSAARTEFGDGPVELLDFDIVSPMRLSDDYLVEVQTRLDIETGTVEISSRRRGSDEGFMLHARGRVFRAVQAHAPANALAHGPSDTVASGAEIYGLAERFGLDYGPAFQRVKLVTKVNADTIQAQLKPLDGAYDQGNAFGIHPAELDGCFGGLIALYRMAGLDAQEGRAYVPVFFGKIQQIETGRSPESAVLKIRRVSKYSMLADFEIYDADDQLIMRIVGGRFRATTFDLLEDDKNLVLRLSEKVLPLPKSAVGLVADSGKSIPSILEPADFLEAAQSTSTLAVSEDERESRLLLEAAAQRAAFDLLEDLAGNDRVIPLDRLPERHRVYFMRAIDLLVQSDEATLIEGGMVKLADASSLPEFDVLIGGVLEENPDEIAATTLLNLAVHKAGEVLEDDDFDAEEEREPLFKPSGAILEHFSFDAPDAKVRFDIALKWLDTFLAHWPEDRPLRVLDLAGSGLKLARHIKGRAPQNSVEILVADPDSASAARLQVGVQKGVGIDLVDASKPLDDAFLAREFDLIVSTGRLHEFDHDTDFLTKVLGQLSETGSFVAIEPQVDLFHDLAFGLRESWFEETLAGEFPIGRLKSADEWMSVLNDAGGDIPTSKVTTIGGTSVSLLHCGRAESANLSDAVDEEDLSNTAVVVECADDAKSLAMARALASEAEGRGAHPVLIVDGRDGMDAQTEESWAKQLKNSDIAAAKKLTFIVIADKAPEPEEPVDTILSWCMGAVQLGKALGERKAELVYLMPHESGPSGARKGLGDIQNALWAFSRVMANEMGHLDVRAVESSLDCEPSESAPALFDLIMNSGNESEISLSADTLRANRVSRGFADGPMRDAGAVRLSFDNPGALSGLKWEEVDLGSLDPDHVEIEVAASGLNFRDVMWSLGMLPEEALEDGYGGPSLGLECSGRIRRVGRSVKGLKKGDAVVAFTSHGFGSVVHVPDIAVAKIGDQYDLVAAATLPVAYLTAYYSLIHLGSLKKDEWLLLHGAAGGVGLAALQIAKWVGAKVIATAGSDEKRALLEMLGADYVLNSRSLDFAEDVRTITEAGVDVVLNSLAGEAMERGMNVMRPFGRFLELGKRDYYANTKIGLRPFRRNISYFGIDVDQLLLHEKKLVKGLIEDLFGLIRDGTFTPLPYRVFEGRNAEDAFRLMQRSGHIGKILITPPTPGEIKVPVETEPLSFSADGAHLVIGGLGGFGSAIAAWLADHGAREIVLTSRSGKVSTEHADLIGSLGKRGVTVTPVACDVTDRASIDAVLTDIRRKSAIKGVIHAAMVLDDGIMAQLDHERFEKVLAPKVTGAKNLAQLTWQDELDHFILFSSATTLIGNPGQSHYVAANGYLEGLARERRRAGRPGLAVGWGAIGDVGFLARNRDVSDKLSRHLGAAMIKAKKGLDLLSKAIERDDGSVDNAVVFIGKFDWNAAHQTLPMLKRPLFEAITAGLEDGKDGGAGIDLAELIAGKSPAEAQAVISDLVVGEIATILRLPVEDIGIKRPLPELGMDSLMGLELRMAVQKRFDLEIPLTAISGDATVEAIAGQILKLVQSSDQAMADNADRSALDLASQHLEGDAAVSEEGFAKINEMITEKQTQVSGLIQ
ncbi:MAG: type I polyketide synthase [Pseudomonadota bacterium]